MYKLSFLKIYLSPFKAPKIKFYFGKIVMGTPYFLPRKWVKISKEEAVKKTEEYFKNHKELVSEQRFNAKVESLLRSTHAVPKKFGFDLVGLGWKTKWDSYRFEWNPMISFVFFNMQLVLYLSPKHDMHYWECWLYYSKESDKSKSTKERIAQSRLAAPCIWSSIGKRGEKISTDYWNLILKKKYL